MSEDESTGFPVDWFVDPPPRGFICDICTDVLNNPQELTTCGHIFCKRCINQWISQNQTCPKDRKNITSSGLRNPSVIWCQMLGDLRVRCPESGCEDVVTLDALSSHRKSCKTTMVQCPGGCGLKMLKNEAIKHSCVHYLQKELAKVKAVSQMNAERHAVLKTRLDDFLKLTDTLDVFQTLGQQIARLKETSEEEIPRTSENAEHAEKLNAGSLDDQQLHQIAKKIVAACSRPIQGRTVETVLKPYDPSSVGPLLHATFDESLHSPETWDILSKRLVDLAKRPDVTTMEAIISGFQAFVSGIGDLRKDYKKSINFVKEIAYRVSLVEPSPLIFVLEVLKPMSEPPQDEFLVNYKSAATRERDVKYIFSVILSKIRTEKGRGYVTMECNKHQGKLQTFFNAEPEMVTSGSYLTCARFKGIKIEGWLYSGKDEIWFKVSKEIWILGFGLFGSSKKDDFDVEISLVHSLTDEVLGSTQLILKSSGSKHEIMKAMFLEPIRVEPAKRYTAVVRMLGGRSYYGTNGVETVSDANCNVSFWFYTNTRITANTNVQPVPKNCKHGHSPQGKCGDGHNYCCFYSGSTSCAFGHPNSESKGCRYCSYALPYHAHCNSYRNITCCFPNPNSASIIDKVTTVTTGQIPEIYYILPEE